MTSNVGLRLSVSALISRWVTLEQGFAIGLNNDFIKMGRSVGPLWAGLVVDINLSYPNWPGSIIMLVNFVISNFKLRTEKNSNRRS